MNSMKTIGRAMWLDCWFCRMLVMIVGCFTIASQSSTLRGEPCHFGVG